MSSGASPGYRSTSTQRGEGAADITYQFPFTTRQRNPDTFLINTGPIRSLNSRPWKTAASSTRHRVAGGISSRCGNGRCPPAKNIGAASTPPSPHWRPALCTPARWVGVSKARAPRGLLWTWGRFFSTSPPSGPSSNARQYGFTYSQGRARGERHQRAARAFPSPCRCRSPRCRLQLTRRARPMARPSACGHTATGGTPRYGTADPGGACRAVRTGSPRARQPLVNRVPSDGKKDSGTASRRCKNGDFAS